MLNIPILRWGKPYTSLDQEEISHFISGEPLARVSQANTGLLALDYQRAKNAREILKEIPAKELITVMGKAASHGGISSGSAERLWICSVDPVGAAASGTAGAIGEALDGLLRAASQFAVVD